MVPFSSIVFNSENKQFIIARLTMWVREWANELFTRVKRLLTNHLHGKAAELCLAISQNNSVTTTKCIEYITITCWCIYNEQMNCLCMYKCLLTNHLHSTATKLCLANS